MERRKDAKQGVDPRFAMEMAVVAIATGATNDDHQPPPTANATTQAMPRTAPPVTQSTKISTPSTLKMSDIQAVWAKLLQAMEANKSLLFILKLSKPESLDGNCLNIQFEYPYHQTTIIQNMKNKMLIENALRELSGDRQITISGSIRSGEAEPEHKAPQDTVSTLIGAFGGQVIS
jgi:hypothetical protein